MYNLIINISSFKLFLIEIKNRSNKSLTFYFIMSPLCIDLLFVMPIKSLQKYVFVINIMFKQFIIQMLLLCKVHFLSFVKLTTLQYSLKPALFLCPVCFCFWGNKVSRFVERKSSHIKKVTSTLSLSLFSQLNQFRSVLNEIFPDTVHPPFPAQSSSAALHLSSCPQYVPLYTVAL